ncbi:MAG TPA: hypothetical protein VIF62_17205 [Labilithrix sp.]|jgi:hypothetical protein
MRFRNALALLFGLALGCAAPTEDAADDEAEDLTASTAPSAAEAKACEAGTVGTDATGAKVVHCTKPFASAPFVRLPADAIDGERATFYGAMTVPTTSADIAVVFARDGKMYAAVDAKGEPLGYGTSGAKLPKALHAPTNRLTFTIYQFKGELGAEVETPYGKATAIRLKDARAVVEVPGCALDSRLLGTFSGSVSERLATPSGAGPWAKAFNESKRVPIHVTLDSIEKGVTLAEYKGGAKLSDAETYVLSGTIDNFDKEVTVSGKKYASLAAMGAKNPFAGAKNGKIQLYRLGNMHGQTNDGHWVLTYPSGSETLTMNGMSYTLSAFTAPSFLLADEKSAPEMSTVTIRPHIPYTANGHSVILTPENVGARVGQCR